MKYVVLILALAISNFASALTVTGKVSAFRTFPKAQSVAAARNHVVFSLDTALSSGCTLLYVAPEDKTSIAVLLAAKFSNTDVTVTYNTESSPWHGPTCNALEVSVN